MEIIQGEYLAAFLRWTVENASPENSAIKFKMDFHCREGSGYESGYHYGLISTDAFLVTHVNARKF